MGRFRFRNCRQGQCCCRRFCKRRTAGHRSRRSQQDRWRRLGCGGGEVSLNGYVNSERGRILRALRGVMRGETPTKWGRQCCYRGLYMVLWRSSKLRRRYSDEQDPVSIQRCSTRQKCRPPWCQDNQYFRSAGRKIRRITTNCTTSGAQTAAPVLHFPSCGTASKPSMTFHVLKSVE